jgi:ribosomal protein S18 acetylase RimI-like enzyme
VWREQITGPLSTAERELWLNDAFEFAELHVHLTAQGRGVGSQLHDALIAAHPHSTALLSVMHRSAVARHLYASRGW